MPIEWLYLLFIRHRDEEAFGSNLEQMRQCNGHFLFGQVLQQVDGRHGVEMPDGGEVRGEHISEQKGHLIRMRHRSQVGGTADGIGIVITPVPSPAGIWRQMERYGKQAEAMVEDVVRSGPVDEPG